MIPRNKKNEVRYNIDTMRQMPQATDIEKLVLGALMIDRDAFEKVFDDLSEDSFYDPRNKIVYCTIRSLGLRSLPIDNWTVVTELDKQGNLSDVGGASYVTELNSQITTSANIEYHAKILAQKERERKIINICETTSARIFQKTDDIDTIQEDIEKKLFDLTQKTVTNTAVDLMSSLRISLKTIQDAQANSDGITGIPSGYTKFDNITAGFQNTDLIILAGRPAMGKTAFAICMAWNMVSRDIPVAFFSLEMSHPQLTNRLISSISRIDGSKLLRGTLDRSEWERIDKSVPEMDKPLYIDDTAGLSLFHLRSKARYLVKVKGVKIIFIDYMQLMSVTGADYSTRQEMVAMVSRGLKVLAKELNVPIIALSQMNRGVESREGLEGKRPKLSDLRDSGAIEQDADMVIFVHRPEYYHIYQDTEGHDMRGKAEIIIAKHRKGATDDVVLTFNANQTRFEDPKDISPQTPPPSSPTSPYEISNEDSRFEF